MASEHERLVQKIYFLENYVFKKGKLRFFLALKDGPLDSEGLQQKAVKRADKFSDFLGITIKEQDTSGQYYIGLTKKGERLVHKLDELFEVLEDFLPPEER